MHSVLWVVMGDTKELIELFTGEHCAFHSFKVDRLFILIQHSVSEEVKFNSPIGCDTANEPTFPQITKAGKGCHKIEF